MACSGSSAAKAVKKWKKGDSTYRRTLETGHESSDNKSLPSQREKMSSKITLTKEGKEKAGENTKVRLIFLSLSWLGYLIRSIPKTISQEECVGEQ